MFAGQVKIVSYSSCQDKCNIEIFLSPDWCLLFTSAAYIQVHFRLAVDIIMEVNTLQSGLGPYCIIKLPKNIGRLKGRQSCEWWEISLRLFSQLFIHSKEENCFSRQIIALCRSKVLQNAPRGSILQYFWTALRDNRSLRPLFCLLFEWLLKKGFTAFTIFYLAFQGSTSCLTVYILISWLIWIHTICKEVTKCWHVP